MEHTLKLQVQSAPWVAALEKPLLIIFLFSVFLMPAFRIDPRYPAVFVSDLLLPFMIVLLLFRYRMSFLQSRYIQLLLLFCAYILLTIAVNGRIGHMRDYFEVLKTIKFAVAVLFIAAAAAHVNLMSLLRAVFVLLVLFNTLQYFGLFGFNEHIEVYYSNDKQLSVFGLNSIGESDTRRLLGTMGNPNPNAILFLFFAALFMPGKASGKYDRLLFYLSVLFIFLCQSRTGFLALIVILITGAVLFRYTWKTILEHTIILPLLYGAFTLIDMSFLDSSKGTYLGSLASPGLAESGSVQGRLQVWLHLWEMIKQKPLLGHAPYKEYLYNNELYPESEYVLMTWRYGFIGLVIYGLCLVIPGWQALQNCTSLAAKRLVLFTVVIGISALTNTPFSDPSIIMIFALAIGMFYAEILNSQADEKAASHRA